MGGITAPVLGSGDCPPWMASVASARGRAPSWLRLLGSDMTTSGKEGEDSSSGVAERTCEDGDADFGRVDLHRLQGR